MKAEYIQWKKQKRKKNLPINICTQHEFLA